MNDSALRDLEPARALALAAARHWGLDLEPPFTIATCSYVAPAGALVVKVSWGGDDESLHEPDALELWDGNGAVRLVDRFGTALLEERAAPGDDLSRRPEREATDLAIAVGLRLWHPARPPFRPVTPAVLHWLDRAEREGSELAPLARELLADVGATSDWVVHGDFHHHNIVRQGDSYVAIDPKPYLSDREYDVPSFLWNPMDNRLEDRAQLERRIEAFVAAGLDESRIRAWTVIRGSYLRPSLAEKLRELLAG